MTKSRIGTIKPIYIGGLCGNQISFNDLKHLKEIIAYLKEFENLNGYQIYLREEYLRTKLKSSCSGSK